MSIQLPQSNRVFPTRALRLTATASAAALCLVGWGGNYHFVYGTPIKGVDRFDKVSWSLSETILNADELDGTPPALLRARYPLFMKAAERDGLLQKIRR